jgi:hypothetical protein
MALWISIGIILALLFVLWIAFGTEPGPGPADVAIAYERAWESHDFDLLYDLSGDEMRDGMHREQFVAAKRSAYGRVHERVDAEIAVEDVVSTEVTALVATRVTSTTGPARPGGSVHNKVVLEKRPNGWLVVGYSIRTA